VFTLAMYLSYAISQTARAVYPGVNRHVRAVDVLAYGKVKIQETRYS